jgi:solute carrier family 25 (mitochondrial phosphate transporter), member 23/24/25/41
METKVVKSNQSFPTFYSLLAGSLSAAASKTATAPLSRITILMQLNSNALKFLPYFKETIKTQGIRSLWRGNLISVLHKFPYGGANYFTYESVKLLLRNHWKDSNDPGMLVRFVSGFAGGATASAVTYPIDILRTRLAASSNASLWESIKSIGTTSAGLRGFYAGLGTTLLCQGGNLAINFAIYETLQVKAILFEKALSKKFFGFEINENKQRSTLFSSLFCGAVSGTTASMTIFPLDLIRRRQQMGDSSGMISIGKKIIHSEGIKGLYRGIVPELVKVIPAVAINFYVYELVRQDILGLKVAPR